MDKDYQKDNFTELDELLYRAARNYNKNLNGSVTKFIGCTVGEIKDIMHTTLSRIVPKDQLQKYLDEADKLIA